MGKCIFPLVGVHNDVIPYREAGNTIYLEVQSHFLESRLPMHLYMYKIMYTMIHNIVLMVKKKKMAATQL